MTKRRGATSDNGFIFKVHIFWEGHKILQNFHLRFHCYYYKSTVEISQNFVGFSEYMNLKRINWNTKEKKNPASRLWNNPLAWRNLFLLEVVPRFLFIQIQIPAMCLSPCQPFFRGFRSCHHCNCSVSKIQQLYFMPTL